MMRRYAFTALPIAAAIALIGQPAFADVKAGVDAWTKGDFAGAVAQWGDPAIKGDPDAQFNMGQAYKLGRGVKQDLNMALEWYRKAAQQGHLQAADNIGHLLHYQGKVPEALPYLQASAERGEPRGQYLLATELFNGTQIEKDWVRAYALMTRASSAGLAPASRSLAEMDKYIPLEQRQQGVALAGVLEQSSAQARSAQVAGFPIDTKTPPAAVKPVPVPPSQAATATAAAAPGFPGAIPPIDGAPEPARAAPAVKPATPSKPAKIAATAPAKGGWRIQLGAFGTEANATRLWDRLEGRVGGLSALTPYLNSAGAVTRLQAGPFASRSSAADMCTKVKAAAAGQACLVVAN
jgi:cell division septation protein DedD